MRSVGRGFNDGFEGWWKMDDDNEQHAWKWTGVTRKQTKKVLRRLVDSAWLDRFGIFCGWLFCFQTTAQLCSAFFQWKANVLLNLVFNVVYTLCYILFLVAYYFLTARPPRRYMVGVALYTDGYAVFVAIYSGCPGSAELYHLGSWLFLIGSVFLM